MRNNQAFTLVELLTVLALMGILAALALPALTSLSNAGNVNQAVNGISLLLGEARSYAMAHGTYVWVGFYPDSPSQKLTVGVVAAKTGVASDLSSISTYTPIAKLQTFEHMELASISNLTGMSTSADDISASQVGTFQQAGAGTTVTFTSILQFSPEGEATIDKTLSGSHWIQIGLQPFRGGAAKSPNVAVFQVGVLTGQVAIFRP